MDYKCSKCGGWLDTGYRCHQCGKVCPPPTETSAVTCTAGNGWCPLHGDQCPVTITRFPQHNVHPVVVQINDIALASLHPGPAAFWHAHLWDKIHATVASHGRRGQYEPLTHEATNMMIAEVHGELSTDGFLHNVEVSR